MDDENAMTPYTGNDYILSLLQSVSEIKTTLNYVKEQIASSQVDSMNGDKRVMDYVEERSKYVCQRQDSIKQELNGKIEVINTQIELQKKINETIQSRLQTVENKDKDKVYGWWGKAGDRIFYIIITIIIAAVFKYFNLTPPKPL